MYLLDGRILLSYYCGIKDDRINIEKGSWPNLDYQLNTINWHPGKPLFNSNQQAKQVSPLPTSWSISDKKTPNGLWTIMSSSTLQNPLSFTIWRLNSSKWEKIKRTDEWKYHKTQTPYESPIMNEYLIIPKVRKNWLEKTMQ